MQSAIVFTVLLAMASAAVLPKFSKSNGQNELIPDNEYTGNYEYAQVREERTSIAGSFDAVVNAMRQYKNELANTDEFGFMENTIFVPDTVNIGNSSDTYMTNVRVTGLKNFRSQNVILSWEKDAVYAEKSWEKLTVNGVYHFISPTGRHSGSFEIVLVDPVYKGNTSLTKNANVYATTSPGASVSFKKAVIDSTALPAVFQGEKPQFDYFVKNVVCRYVAAAVADSMYNDLVVNVRYTVRPYLTYQTGKIGNDVGAASASASVGGKLANGDRFELKNVRFDNAKDNMAKIYFVQMNNTDQINAAELRLRLLNVTGQCDCVLFAADGKSYSGKFAFAFKAVRVVPSMNFNDKTVHTQVFVSAPRVEIMSSADSAAAVWTNVEEQFTPELVEYFKQSVADDTSKNIQNII